MEKKTNIFFFKILFMGEKLKYIFIWSFVQPQGRDSLRVKDNMSFPAEIENTDKEGNCVIEE